MKVTNKKTPLESQLKNKNIFKDSKPKEIYYNKREIRYDKVYPELPWNFNNNEPLTEDKMPLRLYSIKTNQVEEREQIIKRGIKNYATLSYVWGKSILSDEEKEELKKYEQWNRQLNPKSSFKSELTPSGNKALIKAIEACKLLGIDYLWMDKICINQADSEEKGQEVRRMRDYYSNSTVTLVAIQADIEKELLNEWRDSFINASQGFVEKWVTGHSNIGDINKNIIDVLKPAENVGPGPRPNWDQTLAELDLKKFDRIVFRELEETPLIEIKRTPYTHFLTKEMYLRWTSEETDPRKAWEVFFSLHEITDTNQHQAWKESGFDPTWSEEGRQTQVDKVWENNWKDLTINDPDGETGQIKDWQKDKKIFTYVSYGYETKEVDFLKHDKEEIDKVHKILADIIRETDPTNSPNFYSLHYATYYNLIPDSINLSAVKKIWKTKERELWSSFFNTHDLTDEKIQELWKSTGLNPKETEIAYNNGWVDLKVNDPDNDIGKIFNLNNKSFDYTSWKQTIRVDPLIQTKAELDLNHWDIVWEKFFAAPRNVVEEKQKIAWKSSGLNPFEEANTAYEQRNWHDLTINNPSNEVGQIKDWNHEDKTFTYTSYNYETKEANVLQHDKKQVDQVHKVLVDIANEIDPTNLPTDEILKNVAGCQEVPQSIQFSFKDWQKRRNEKEQELWSPFFDIHNIEDKNAQKLWKSSGLNLFEAEQVYNNSWTDLTINSPNDGIGRISNLSKKTFDYTSWEQATEHVNPLTQPKFSLDTIHLNLAWENFFKSHCISNEVQQTAWKNSGLNPLKEAEKAYNNRWHDLTINNPENEIGLIENWNKTDKSFTYTSYGLVTPEVKILEHNKLVIDKIHKLLVDISRQPDPTKLPTDKELEELDYNLVPDSISLEKVKKIRDEKENKLWQPFFTAHDIQEEKQRVWKRSSFNPAEAETVWSNGWKDLSGFSITDKQFTCKLAGKEYKINPFIHEKGETDKAHGFFKEVINKDFVDLPEREEVTKYEEKKVPSELSLNEFKKIWDEKKIGVKKRVFEKGEKKWVSGISSPLPSLKVMDIIINSEWFERTWTFQEGLLPKRTLFMFDNVLVDGRAMACLWDHYETHYEYGSTVFSGLGEKLATPIGWTYHNDYNAEDKVSLGLWEALNLVKSRKSTVSVDGLYSILGLLPYGKEVNVKYKPRICPECPSREEFKGCLHEEKNKQWPTYTQKELEEILIEIVKTAVEHGYGEPLTWLGSSDSWLPKVNEKGSIEVEGGLVVGLKNKDLSDSIKFTSVDIEIVGSEHSVVLDKSEEIQELLDLEEIVNVAFSAFGICPTVRLMIDNEPHVIIKDEWNSPALEKIEDGDVLIIPNERDWEKAMITYDERKEDGEEGKEFKNKEELVKEWAMEFDSSIRRYNKKPEELILTILASKDEDDVYRRKGLLLIREDDFYHRKGLLLIRNVLEKKKQQKFVIVDEKKLLPIQIERLKNLVNSAKEKLKSKSIFPIKKEEKTKKQESFLQTLLETQKKITVFLKRVTIGEEFNLLPLKKDLENAKQELSKKLTEKELDDICKTQDEIVKLQLELEELDQSQYQAQIEIK